MDKFQTNVAGNIDSGTEVLANNLTFMQNGTEKLFTDFFGNTFITGILNTNDANTMFPLTANTNGTFSVGVGIAYLFDPITELYKRIEINVQNTTNYNINNPNQETDDGTGSMIKTPKSTGCLNIPIESSNVTYWIDLQYLQICNNGNTGDELGLRNYSIAKKINPTENNQKRFYQWEDGYKIVLQTTKSNVQGICLGTVIKANGEINFSYSDRIGNLVINPNVFLEYLENGNGIIISQDTNTGKFSISVDNSVSFSINDGPISGYYLVVGGQVIQLNVSSSTPLILHPANAARYSVSSNDVEPINIQLAAQELEGTTTNINGIYTLCINNTDKDNDNIKLVKPKFELMRDVVVSKTQPSGGNATIWLDVNTQPYIAKYKKGAQYVPYYGVPVAYVLVQNTALVEDGVALFDYNKDYSKWDDLGKLSFVLYKIDDNKYPDKYLIINGATLNVIDYYDFYKATKHTFDGVNTTFELPDAMGKVLWGGLTITTLEAGLPNIAGRSVYALSSWNAQQVAIQFTGAYTPDNIGPGENCWNWNAALGNTGSYNLYFNASDGECGTEKLEDDSTINYQNNVYGKSNTVQPPSLQVPFLVKVLL